jgi:hypothetical protein
MTATHLTRRGSSGPHWRSGPRSRSSTGTCAAGGTCSTDPARRSPRSRSCREAGYWPISLTSANGASLNQTAWMTKLWFGSLK